ncbi:SHOCT domain-containing protein [Chloroflexota bacterium]
MWYMHEGAGWWMVFGGIWMFLFWGGLIALIVWAISKLTGHNRNEKNKLPFDIARERYAKGEISREQLEQIKKDLL